MTTFTTTTRPTKPIQPHSQPSTGRKEIRVMYRPGRWETRLDLTDELVQDEQGTGTGADTCTMDPPPGRANRGRALTPRHRENRGAQSTIGGRS